MLFHAFSYLKHSTTRKGQKRQARREFWWMDIMMQVKGLQGLDISGFQHLLKTDVTLHRQCRIWRLWEYLNRGWNSKLWKTKKEKQRGKSRKWQRIKRRQLKKLAGFSSNNWFIRSSQNHYTLQIFIKKGGRTWINHWIYMVQSKWLYISDSHQERRENLN